MPIYFTPGRIALLAVGLVLWCVIFDLVGRWVGLGLVGLGLVVVCSFFNWIVTGQRPWIQPETTHGATTGDADYPTRRL